MAGPSVSWPSGLTPGGSSWDADSPLTGNQSGGGGPQSRAQDIEDALTWLREVAYFGDGSLKRYIDDAGHEHRGKDDSRIVGPCSHNVLLAPFPDSDTYWLRTGWSIATEDVLEGGALADRVSQSLLTGKRAGDAANFVLWGDGSPLVASVWARAAGTLPTAGELSFGISTTDGPGGWTTGHRAAVAYGSLTAAWQRFFALLDDSVGTYLPCSTTIHTSSSLCPRFLCEATAGFNQTIQITGFAVTRGRTLQPCTINPIDNYHDGWEHMPDAPVYEQALGLSGAVELTPV